MVLWYHVTYAHDSNKHFCIEGESLGLAMEYGLYEVGFPVVLSNVLALTGWMGQEML